MGDTGDLAASLQALSARMQQSAAALAGAGSPPAGTAEPQRRRGFVRAPAPQSSPFLQAASGLQRTSADRATLTDLALACMQRASVSVPGTLVLLTLPERVDEDSPATDFDAMARAGLSVVVMSNWTHRHVSEDGRQAHRVPLRADDPLGREWNVVIAGPAHRLAFLARADGSAPMDSPELVYQWGVVRSSRAVGVAAEHLLTRLPHLALSLPAHESATADL